MSFKSQRNLPLNNFEYITFKNLLMKTGDVTAKLKA